LAGIGEQRFAYVREARTAVGAVFIGDAFYPKRTRTHGGGTVTSVEQIAARDKCSVRQVNMMISLAFLAPKLVQAAVEGRTRAASRANCPTRRRRCK
jgi:hypothetical protein